MKSGLFWNALTDGIEVTPGYRIAHDIYEEQGLSADMIADYTIQDPDNENCIYLSALLFHIAEDLELSDLECSEKKIPNQEERLDPSALGLSYKALQEHYQLRHRWRFG